jgi:SAM-dependent methyltransferase
MAFANGIPTQSAFDQYYRDFSKYAYEHRGGKESEDDEWRLRQAANALQRFLSDRSIRILEIGSASGRLLRYLKDAGYENTFGLDPSPACSEAADSLYGVTVFTGSVFAPPLPDRPYDFVFLLGVLEHIRDVDVAVRGLHRLLSNAGRVYVEVPDATNFIVEQDAPFQEFSTEHINFFSPPALRYLMEAAGFRTVECGSEVRHYRTGGAFPVVYGVFERSNQARTEFPRHPEAEAGLRRYIDLCRRMDSELRLRIDQALNGSAGVIVWGVGTLTQRLLATGALNIANIVAFVDSNPKYQNQQLRGISVIGPEALKNRPEPILISSYAFQEEIANQIRAMSLPNELILLHAADSAAVKESV